MIMEIIEKCTEPATMGKQARLRREQYRARRNRETNKERELLLKQEIEIDFSTLLGPHAVQQ